jgi:hypothetical protein
VQGDLGGAVGKQEQHGVRDLLGLGDPAGGDAETERVGDALDRGALGPLAR